MKLGFKDALKIDMERKGFSEASLGKALGISQQAIHKWFVRGFPPLSKLDALLAVLGPDSEVAKLDRDELYSSRSRTPAAIPALGTIGYTSGPDSAGLRDLHNRVEMAASDALPPELRANLERAVTIGERVLRVDYMSPKLVAELVYTQGSSASRNTSSTMLQLLTVAACHPGTKPVLIVVRGDDGPERPLSRQVNAAAQQFGVEIVNVRSGPEAARAIAEREGITTVLPTYLMEPDE